MTNRIGRMPGVANLLQVAAQMRAAIKQQFDTTGPAMHAGLHSNLQQMRNRREHLRDTGRYASRSTPTTTLVGLAQSRSTGTHSQKKEEHTGLWGLFRRRQGRPKR